MPAHFKEQLNSLNKTRRHIAIITGKKGRNTSFLFKGKNIEVYCSILAYSPCLATVNQPPNKKKTEIKEKELGSKGVSSPNVLRKEVFKSFLFLTLLIKRMIDGVKTTYHPSVIKLLPPIRLLITTR